MSYEIYHDKRAERDDDRKRLTMGLAYCMILGRHVAALLATSIEPQYSGMNLVNLLSSCFIA